MKGTIDFWIKYKPDALLVNRRLAGGYGPYFPNGVYITKPQYYEQPIDATYESYYPGGEPYYMFAPKCPYISKGQFHYTCLTVTVFGAGSPYVLTEEMANSPHWEEVDDMTQDYNRHSTR